MSLIGYMNENSLMHCLCIYSFILCLATYPLLVDFVLECAIRQSRENLVTQKLNATHIEVAADYMNLLDGNHKEKTRKINKAVVRRLVWK